MLRTGHCDSSQRACKEAETTKTHEVVSLVGVPEELARRSEGEMVADVEDFRTEDQVGPVTTFSDEASWSRSR